MAIHIRTEYTNPECLPSGYWSAYGLLTAAHQSGSIIEVLYVRQSRQRHGGTLTRAAWRQCIILGPVQRSAAGDHYVKIIDLDADAPRTLRLDRVRAIQA